MKTIILMTFLSVFSIASLGQKHFKITFSNLKNDVAVKILYNVIDNDKKVVLTETFEIPSRSKLDKTIKVRNNQYFEVYPSSTNKLFLRVIRTYNELKSTTLINGISPLNVNIVQLENMKNSSIEVTQLMDELSTNSVLNKLLDTTKVIIDSKIRIGSFLIYNETDKSFIEVFEPTKFWYDRKNVEVFNQNDETLSKTTTKNSIANANIKIPDVLKTGGSSASSDYFDFRWKVYNFREEKLGVTNEIPQTLFKNYPDLTGYNLFKNLIKNGEKKEYKVYFISAWSLTDSIETFIDSYTGVERKIDCDINYPPLGTKVFGIDGKAAFLKAYSESKESVKKNIYNYFEVSDITVSALQMVTNDIQLDKEIQREELRKSQLKMIEETLSNLENKIKGVYNALVSIDNQYMKTDDINVILQIPLYRKTTQEINDTLRQEVKEKMISSNLQVNTHNSFVNFLETKKQEYNERIMMRDEFVFAEKNMVYGLEKQIEATVTIRKFTNDEFKALISFSKK